MTLRQLLVALCIGMLLWFFLAALGWLVVA